MSAVRRLVLGVVVLAVLGAVSGCGGDRVDPTANVIAAEPQYEDLLARVDAHPLRPALLPDPTSRAIPSMYPIVATNSVSIRWDIRARDHRRAEVLLFTVFASEEAALDGLDYQRHRGGYDTRDDAAADGARGLRYTVTETGQDASVDCPPSATTCHVAGVAIRERNVVVSAVVRRATPSLDMEADATRLATAGVAYLRSLRTFA